MTLRRNINYNLYKKRGNKMDYELTERISYNNQFEVVNNLTKEFFPKACPSKKNCIFCKRNESEVSFKKPAHIIPAALGNKLLFSLVECDECNQKFGDTLENDLCNDIYAIRAFTILKYFIDKKKWNENKETQNIKIIISSYGSSLACAEVTDPDNLKEKDRKIAFILVEMKEETLRGEHCK